MNSWGGALAYSTFFSPTFFPIHPWYPTSCFLHSFPSPQLSPPSPLFIPIPLALLSYHSPFTPTLFLLFYPHHQLCVVSPRPHFLPPPDFFPHEYTFLPPQDTEGLFIKSNFECVRHNERKAVKILNSASKENQVLKTGESVSAMYFNNLGCLHFQMQKYNLASFYFCRAIAENEKALALIASGDKSK